MRYRAIIGTALLLLTLSSSVRADSWSFLPEITTKTYTFGTTRFVQTTDGSANQKLPKYSLAIYSGDKELALYPGLAVETLHASPNNVVFVGLSNSGLPGTAVVIFDASGSIRLLATHGIADFDYCQRSVTLMREWYDADTPELDFQLDAQEGKFGIFLRDCRGKRIELFRTVFEAYQRAAGKWPRN